MYYIGLDVHKMPHVLGLSLWLTQTVKTLFSVR
jgi:hypothetical protein